MAKTSNGSTRQQVVVLGATGSIGTSTLDVLTRHADRFDVFALVAGRQVEAMWSLCLQHRPKYVVMADAQAAQVLADRVKDHALPIQVAQGEAAMCAISAHPDVDQVMAAIVGAAGLAPALAAARAGKRILLANKEALVVGGRLFLEAVRQGQATLLPIDSEHSAIFQSLPEDQTTWKSRVDKIILTASGGPFRTRDPKTMHLVTPKEACAHPNWSMGQKISVDSATMMNKALEVIEAHYLFGMSPDQLEVVIHPQSIVHSMVQYVDHSIVAQLGGADMRVPIAYGLSWPQRMNSGAAALDFRQLAGLTFESPDPFRFPGLSLAWDALRAPEGSTAVLNAANEVAVAAFLQNDLSFDQIALINREVLTDFQPAQPNRLEDLFEIDLEARAVAQQCVAKRQNAAIYLSPSTQMQVASASPEAT